MAKRTKMVLLGLLVIFLCILVWLTQRPSEPLYKGKRLSAWLKDLEYWEGDTNDAAFVAFREMGTNAIPPLLSMLQSGNGRFSKLILKVNRRLSFLELPFGRPSEQAMAATWALYAMGPAAKPALPVLTNLLFHSNEIITSTTVMAGMGSEALPCLLTAITNQDYRLRFAVASALGWEHSNMDLIVPALIECLRDTNKVVRHAAAVSLGQLHAEPNVAVPALLNSFPGNDGLHRGLILVSLGQFEDKAKEAIPMVLEALKGGDTDVSNSAVFALKRIDPEAAAKAGIK